MNHEHLDVTGGVRHMHLSMELERAGYHEQSAERSTKQRVCKTGLSYDLGQVHHLPETPESSSVK